LEEPRPREDFSAPACQLAQIAAPTAEEHLSLARRHQPALHRADRGRGALSGAAGRGGTRHASAPGAFPPHPPARSARIQLPQSGSPRQPTASCSSGQCCESPKPRAKCACSTDPDQSARPDRSGRLSVFPNPPARLALLPPCRRAVFYRRDARARLGAIGSSAGHDPDQSARLGDSDSLCALTT